MNKNLIAGDKSVNKNDNNISKATYSNFPKTKDSLSASSLPPETNNTTGDTNFPTELISIVPPNEKSLPYPEIISLAEENSQ
jgi:hypothetical protein